MSEFYMSNYTAVSDSILSRMPLFWNASKNSEAGLCALSVLATQFLYLRFNKPSDNDPNSLFSDKYVVSRRIVPEYAEIAFTLIELRNSFSHEYGTQSYREVLDSVKSNRKLLLAMLQHVGCMPTPVDYAEIRQKAEDLGYDSPTDFIAELCERIHPFNYKAILKEARQWS